MKSYLQRKLDAEECDILDLAAAMLKMEIGDRGPEIAVDDYTGRNGRFGDRRGRDERDSRRRWGRDESREGRRRSGRDESGEGRRGESRKSWRDESGEGSRRIGRDEGREGSRRAGRGESGEDRRRRSRDEVRDNRRPHSSKERDVRMDGSEKGLAFSFPKKKKKR